MVGRTGSGKSSLFQVLFRTSEVNKGEVTIDGVNTKLLNLTELRSHLSIIPQGMYLLIQIDIVILFFCFQALILNRSSDLFAKSVFYFCCKEKETFCSKATLSRRIRS